MKFIHLTDTHVIGEGLLYGQDPAERLVRAVASINAEHSDAAFVIVTGDLTHWGDADAYATFAREIDKLTVPVHLMMGNHDDTPALAQAFPDIPRDENGFVQTAFETSHGRFLLLDTKAPEGHAGAYCDARLAVAPIGDAGSGFSIHASSALCGRDQSDGCHHDAGRRGVLRGDRSAPTAYSSSVFWPCAPRHLGQLAGYQLFVHARFEPPGGA
ncbi:MAG: metallophosphoesterase [Pseudomonadota bacterium]